MLSRKQPRIGRGEIITAARLNGTDFTASRADALTPGGGGGGLRVGGIATNQPAKATTALLTVEMTQDCVPSWWAAASSGGVYDLDNGLVLAWDPTLGDWAYTGVTVNVTADSLPLLAGDRCTVYFDYATGLYYPVRQRETYWARPLSSSATQVYTPDGAGVKVSMFAAVIQLFAADTLAFEDTADTQANVVQNCWLYDPRLGPLDPSAGYPVRLVGYVGGLPIFALTGTSSGSTATLVQITARTYPAGGSPFAAYSCNFITDSTSPNPLTYTAGAAGPTFYNENDVDLPVGMVCEIAKSKNGTWYLSRDSSRVDVIRKTGTTPDANGFYDGVLERYNDTTKQLEDRGSIKLLDMTGP